MKGLASVGFLVAVYRQSGRQNAIGLKTMGIKATLRILIRY
jgi:hypothetical protein